MHNFTYIKIQHNLSEYINPLNAELNPIRHLLAVVGAHHILHVSRERVKLMLKLIIGAMSVQSRRI